MMNLEIRNATVEDVIKILKIAPGLINETGMHRLADFDYNASLETMVVLATGEQSVILVAHDDRGNLIGFLGGQLSQGYWEAKPTLAQHMFWWVHPEARGDKVGRSLRIGFEEWGKDAGASVLTFSMPAGSNSMLPDDYTALETHYTKRL